MSRANHMGESTAVDEDVNSAKSINCGDIVVRSRYAYPKTRFSNLFFGFVILDTLLAVILWLTGGDSQYFVDNITHYRMTTSVFDLAVMSLLKCAIFLPLIHQLDKNVKKSFDVYNSVIQSRQRLIFVFMVFLSLAIFIFCVTKGGLVLNEILNAEEYTSMHGPYYACVIWCVVTSLCSLILSSLSLKLMKRMKNSRTQHFFNELNQEIEKDGKLIEKDANIFRLLGLAKPEWKILTLACIMLLASAAVQTLAPLFFGRVVDASLKSMEELNRTVIILLGLYVAGAVASMLRSWLFVYAGQRLVARLRSRLFASVAVQEIAFFDASRTGDLCNRLSSDTQVVQNAITVNVSMLFRYILQIAGSLALMFYLNAALTGVLLAVVPVVSLGVMQYGKFVQKMSKRFQDKLAEAGTKAEEALSSIRTVKSFSGEVKEITDYGHLIKGSLKIGKKLAIAQGAMEGVMNICAYGAISAVLWYGGKLVNDNTKDPDTGITAGLLTSFLLYTLQVAMGFAVLSSLYGAFMQAVGASAKIFKLLDRKPEIHIPENPVVLSTLSGELAFHHVDFTYASRKESMILKDISFTVKPGEMVALVGPSGGGKSTIVSLIERFYDPIAGTITIDGHDLKTLDTAWYRSHISLVSQEPTLFACSVKDNIAYGRGARDEEIEEAARQANAHEFVSEFDEGYASLVGERGVKLSGGQKQRVAIARALIMNPKILLLDEATSALDAESEHLVKEAVDRAMEGRTVLIIAHRLSTVKNANKVIVIDKGRIAEMGTHSELLAKNGVYKRLVLRQLTTENKSNNAEEDDSFENADGKEAAIVNDGVRGNVEYSNEGFVVDDDDVPLIDV